MSLDIARNRDGTRPTLRGLTSFDNRRSYHAFMHIAPSSSLLPFQARISGGCNARLHLARRSVCPNKINETHENNNC